MRENLREGSSGGFILTILCGHNFHWLCIKDWSDSTCPLCRYYCCPQETSTCEAPDCNVTDPEKLMMCLVCGAIGCFQSALEPTTSLEEVSETKQDEVTHELASMRLCVKQSGHAVEHYETGKHVYAQNMES